MKNCLQVAVCKRFKDREIRSLSDNLVGHSPHALQVFLGFILAGFTVYFVLAVALHSLALSIRLCIYCYTHLL